MATLRSMRGWVWVRGSRSPPTGVWHSRIRVRRDPSRLFSAPYVLAPLATTRSAEPSSALCVTSPVIQAETTLTIAKTPLSSQSPASFRPLSGRGANSGRYLDRRRSATRCLRRHALATRNTAKATTINQALRMICPGRTRSLSKSR